MISPAVRPLAITLLFAVGVLAVVLAPPVFNPSSVGAHDCDEGPAGHVDSHGIACGQPGHDEPLENVIEVDGGRDNDYEFRVYPPSDLANYLDAGDQIKIKLMDFRMSGLVFNTAALQLIDISGSNDPATPLPLHPTGVVVTNDAPDTLLITLSDLTGRIVEGEHLIITIKEGTGILAPQTPKGFNDPTQDDEEEAHKVDITFVDAAGVTNSRDVRADDENLVVVKNPLGSTEPGATVRIDLATHAKCHDRQQ